MKIIYIYILVRSVQTDYNQKIKNKYETEEKKDKRRSVLYLHNIILYCTAGIQPWRLLYTRLRNDTEKVIIKARLRVCVCTTEKHYRTSVM